MFRVRDCDALATGDLSGRDRPNARREVWRRTRGILIYTIPSPAVDLVFSQSLKSRGRRSGSTFVDVDRKLLSSASPSQG